MDLWGKDPKGPLILGIAVMIFCFRNTPGITYQEALRIAKAMIAEVEKDRG